MKKVLSFCILSVLLAVLSLGLKAQSGLVLNPANLSEVVVNQYDTVYLSANSACFDALGLNDTSRVSIEWQVLYNGSVIPDDSLSFYFEEFKFESSVAIGSNVSWWGNSYVSGYCQNGNGYGTYPGANTPIANAGNGHICSDPGHFIISMPGQTNPCQYDYFNVMWFSNPAQTTHRLVYNVKVDGDYQFVFSLGRRCGGDDWTTFKLHGAGHETDYIGGHQSVLCGILSSDTLHTAEISAVTDYFRCVGDTLFIGNPLVAFTASTDTTVAPGYDSVFYMGPSSCNAAIDSIVRFRVFFEDPTVPVLDTANSILALCDSGQISIMVNLTAADKSIWLDAAYTVIDTLNASTAFTDTINANTQYYVLGYNSASGCVSSDTLTVYTEVFTSPNPVVTATPDTLCENGSFVVTLDQEYDIWTWFHDGTDMNLDTIAYSVADAQTSDAGAYWAEVGMKHVHSVYPTVDTITCSASDTVTVVVFTRPSVAWATLDNIAVVDSTTFCPNDLEHVLVATITGGQAPYNNIHWTGTAGTASYNANKSSDTLSITLPDICDTVYSFGIDYAIDSNGCTLKDTITVTLFVNDTIVPTISKTRDTVSAPAYASCEFVLPDVLGIIDTADDCGIDTVYQFPEAGQHVTTDTIIIVTVTDLCGNTATDTINVALPFEAVAIDTIEVTRAVQCAGNADGEINVKVENGLAPYDVRIQSMMVTDSIKTAHGVGPDFAFTGLIEGKWAVSVTDTNGCTTAVDTIDVASPNVLTLSDSVLANLTCFESNDGSFKFNVKQGTSPYQVKIIRTLGAVIDSVEMTLNSATLDTTVIMTDQKAGSYVINVKDDHGCTASGNLTLTQPEQLVLVGDTVLAHVLCFGDTTGQLAVTGVTGGTYPYKYAWVNEANDTVSTDSVTGLLPAGIYTIYVTDTNGCTANQTLKDTIEQPHGELTLTSSDWTDLTCFESNDGSFKYNVTEGTAPYYVTIVRTLGTDTETINDTLNPSVLDTTVLMQNMKAGAYFISLVDDHGCVVDTIRDTLTQPDQLTLVCDTILNHVKCFGDANGNLAVTGVTGGTTPYVYEWRYAANDSVVSHDSVTGRILTVGTYTIYITDANNCAPNDTLSATILGPDTALTVLSLVAPVNDTCPHLGNYEFNAEVKGGRTDYTFQWTFNTVEVKNITTSELKDTFKYAETVISCDTTFDIVFTVTDDSACTASKNITFTIQDTIKPTLAGTIDTLYIDACDASAAPDTLNTVAKMVAFGLTLSDNCTPVDSLTVNYSEVVTGTCPIEVVRTYSVTDKCGLTSDELKQVFYVQDTTAPVFTTLPVSDSCKCGSGSEIIKTEFEKANKLSVAATDNCQLDTIIIVCEDTIIGCNSATKTFVYSFTAKDKCGNTTVKEATFRIYDTIAPDVVPAPTYTVECDAVDTTALKASQLALYNISDNCAPDADIVVTDRLSDFTRDCGGMTGYYVHFVTVSDGCQETTKSDTISIVDNTAPYFVGSYDNKEVNCDGQGNLDTLISWVYNVNAVDACSGIEFDTLFYREPGTNNYLVFDTLGHRDAYGHYDFAWIPEDANNCRGSYDFRWKVVDSCGNFATLDMSYFINDNTPPVFEARHDTTIYCQHDPIAFNAWLVLDSAYDDCSMKKYAVTFDTVFYPGCGSEGEYRITWRTVDDCGNATNDNEHRAVWTIKDTLAPQIVTSNYGNLLSPDTLYYGQNWPYTKNRTLTSWWKTGMDETESDDFIDAFLHGGSILDDNNVAHTIPNAAGVTSIDECGYLQSFYFIVQDAPSSVECVDSLLVEYTFVDACDSQITITQEVIILDTSAPVFNNIADIMYLLGPDQSCVKQPVDTFFTVDELNAHTPTAPASELPNVTDKHNMTIVLDSILPGSAPNACDSVEIRYYTISDVCGNSAVFKQTITYQDTVRPQLNITEMTDSIHQMEYGKCDKYSEIEVGHLYDSLRSETWLYDRYGLVISDCHEHTISFVSQTVESDDAFCPGKVFVRKYKVEKSCAPRTLTSYFTVRLVVKDTIAPVRTAATLHDTNVYFKADCSFDLPEVQFEHYSQLKAWAGGSDLYNDCNLGVENNVTVYGPFTSGDKCDSIITYKYTVADSCGNMSLDSVSLTIHVLDTLAPVINVATATLVDTMYYENDCSIPSPLNYWTKPADALNHHVEFEDCFPAEGTDKLVRLSNEVSERDNCTTIITVPYQVKDSCGNISDTIFQVIHILDTVRPVASTVKDTATYMIDDASACWGPEVPYFHTVGEVKAYDAAFTVTDCNVGDNSTVAMIHADSSDIVLCTRTVVRYYVVYDSCGLASDEFTHTITVEDTTAPAITGALAPQQVTMTEDCGFTYTVYGKVSELPTSITINDCTLVDTLYSVIDTFATAYIDACNKAYTVNIAYTVKDSCNHASMFYDTVYVADNIAPKVEGLLDTATLYLTEACGYTVPDAYTSVAYVNAHTNLTITDCKLMDTIKASVIDTVGFWSDCPLFIHRTCTVSDSCGNEATFDQFFFVSDTFAPKVSNVTLTNDTVYIAEDGTYTAPTAFTTVAELNTAGAGITDCNLVQEVNSYAEIPTISHTVCENYLTRKYTVKDSCNNVSDTIFHKIVLMDTVKPVMQNMPDTVWATFVDPCTFKVPDLRDTVARHYHDNWTDPYDASYFVSQVPDAGAILVNPNDTLVVVTFKDACGNQNTDTVRIINWADTEAPTYSGDLSFEAFFAGNCTFEVPNLEDTIKNHYADNWNTFYSTGSYNTGLFDQIPASGYQIPHFTDTVVTVIYGDKCGNKDTVEITITVPDSLHISVSMDSLLCFEDNTGKIHVEIAANTGTPNYVYTYEGTSTTDTIITNLTDTIFKNLAADTYIVKVTDSYQCFDTAKIQVLQPAQLTLTPVAINLENCLNGDTTQVAMVMTGGTLNYNMTATLMHSDYTTVNTVFEITGNTTGYSDTVKINPVADTLYVDFYGEDAHGCSVRDTSDMIVVHPIYQFDTAARVCLTSIQTAGKYVWRGKDFAASIFADVADSTYTLYDSRHTIHLCDSVYVMHLQVTNNPYLMSRKTPATYANNISDAVEQVIEDTLTTQGGTMSWEFFVNKNCMNCTDNNQVSIQYEWYVKNGDTYEQLPDVTNYFFPQYRTYYDNTQMEWFPASNNIEAANVLAFEIPRAYGAYLLSYQTNDYYNLCWLMPTYNESCLATHYPSYTDLATYGNFYNGGRAHTVRLSNFAQSGDYKLVVTLRKRAGGTPLNAFTTFSGCMDYNKVGGENSHYVEDYDTAVVYFNVPDGMTTPAITPAPIGGSVIYSSNNEDEPQAIVYPNPARDFVQVEITGFEGQTSVFFSNTDGKVLQNINLDIDDVNTTTVVKIATGDYAQGVYMVTARNKESIITKRVVLIK